MHLHDKESALIQSVSPSQYTTYQDLCRRKWWFGSVLKLPDPPKGPQTYGTVLHACIERYLKADVTGRDPATGKAVDLYPAGWRSAKERDGTTREITLEEGEQIKHLIQLGIEKGVIYRPQDVLVEHEYWSPPIIGTIREHGFIDMATETTVRDWKTRGRRRYSLSEAELKTDLQMRCYSAELRRIRVTQNYPDIPIEASHAYFIKGESEIDVFERKTTFTPEDLDKHSEEVLTIVEGMVVLSEVAEDAWKSVEGPVEGSNACNKYGGCPYREICSGGSSPGMYRTKMTRVAKANQEREARMSETGKRVSVLEMMRRKPAEAVQLTVTATSASTITGAPSLAAPRPVDLPGPVVPFEEAAPINPTESFSITATRPRTEKMIEEGIPGAVIDGKTKAEQIKQLAAIGIHSEVIRVDVTTAEDVRVTEAGRIEVDRKFTQIIVGPDLKTPPWANPTCVACGGSGFASNMTPCRPCDSNARRLGRVTSSTLRPRIEDGKPVWDELVESLDTRRGIPSSADGEGTTVSPSATPAPVEPSALAEVMHRGVVAEMAPKKKRGRQPLPRDEHGNIIRDPEAPRPAPRAPSAPKDPGPSGRELAAAQGLALTGEPLQLTGPPPGRAQTTGSPEDRFRITPTVEAYAEVNPVGFTLSINSHVLVNRGKPLLMMDFHVLFMQAGDALAKENGKESYFDIETFPRREALRRCAKLIVRELIPAGTWVIASHAETPDEKELLAALRPLADLVIES